MSLLTQFYPGPGGGGGNPFDSTDFSDYGTFPDAVYTGIWGTGRFRVTAPLLPNPPATTLATNKGFYSSLGGSSYYVPIASAYNWAGGSTYYQPSPAAEVVSVSPTIEGGRLGSSDVVFVNYTADLGTGFTATRCKSITGFKWEAISDETFPSGSFNMTCSVDSNLVSFTNLSFGTYRNSSTGVCDVIISINGGTNLTDLNLTPFDFLVNAGFCRLGFRAQNAKLSAASVNNILTTFNAAVSAYPSVNCTVNCFINLSGGTSAGTSQLTPAGLAARSNLVSRGFVVTLNA
jgi:hypothetical protein